VDHYTFEDRLPTLKENDTPIVEGDGCGNGTLRLSGYGVEPARDAPEESSRPALAKWLEGGNDGARSTLC
jgi:hypothetical protein